ncbi:MAG: DUF1289 domain-containing protein [Sphingorhabdus sp.]
MGSEFDAASAARHFALGATRCAGCGECLADGLARREVSETPSPSISSPCLAICRLDPSDEYCLGCGRTLDEIAGWTRASDAERREIVAQLPDRLLRLNVR